MLWEHELIVAQASDYVQENGGSPYKAMLLNEVVLGNEKVLTRNNQTLRQVRATHAGSDQSAELR